MSLRGLVGLCRWALKHWPLPQGKGFLLDLLRSVNAGEPMTVRLRNGTKLLVRLDTWVGQHTLVHGVWEPESTAALQRLLRPGDLFVDVGANIGYFTLLGAHLVGNAGTVLAYEPVSTTYQWLQRNLALNEYQQVSALQAAVGDTEGQVELHLYGDDAHLLASQYVHGGAPVSQTESAPVVTLDAQLRDCPPDQPLVLKVDAEGAEPQVFRGAAKTLAGRRPLLMFELNSLTFTAAGWQPQELLDLLRELGDYTFLVALDGPLRPLQPADLTADIFTEVFAYCPAVDWHVRRISSLLEAQTA